MCICVHVWETVVGETVGDWGRDKEIRAYIHFIQNIDLDV